MRLKIFLMQKKKILDLAAAEKLQSHMNLKKRKRHGVDLSKIYDRIFNKIISMASKTKYQLLLVK